MSTVAVVLPCPVADRRPSRPLPSIPTSQLLGSSKTLSLLPNESHHVPKSRPLTLRSSSPSLDYTSRMTPISLVSVLQEPRILSSFLRYVHWDDFQSLALICTACSNVLQHPKLRDVVLSAFVPNYWYCLRHADVDSPSNIAVQFSHLSRFMISQQVPLHYYPSHALAALSAKHNTPILEQNTQTYILLCQAHSRMVLLLQALIHSSPLPVPEELEDPSLRYRNVAQQGGRELVFPAPLSFIATDVSDKNPALQRISKEHARFFTMATASGRPRRMESDAPRRSSSRMSVLWKNKVPPPPPSATPLSLKIYSGSWRGPRRTSMISSDDDQTLSRRTKLRFARMTDSSGSSTDNSQGSPSPPSPHLTDYLPSPSTSLTPHDIRTAVSRLRAPILRVYFPCTTMDQRAISACEVQLEDAELWQHLSVGDVVCNLGYLPPVAGEGSPNNGDQSGDATLGPESWMIFDGASLLPYTPSAILPLSEPLSLPSPFYYGHITFPPVNPRFVATLPHEEPEFSLVLLPVKVRSPHSPNGVARIKKYLWLARLRPHVRPGLGEGWHCQWILEGEGTKEGRQSLLDALRGDAGAQRTWELVMERCTAIRIWLRLMSTVPPTS